jgi:hypothetical protein
VTQPYQAFSSTLSTGVFQSDTQPSLAPGAPSGCQVLYGRENATGLDTAILNETITPGHCGHPMFAGQAKDGSKTIFQTEAALTHDAHPAVETPEGREPGQHTGRANGGETGEPCEFGCDLYMSTSTGLSLVSRRPEGQIVSNATFGGYSRQVHKADFSGAISADGSRVFWTDTTAGADMERVYVLEDDSREVQVSGADPAEYWTATADGRLAFFTEDGALWRFDTDTNTRERLEDPSAEVQGVVGTNTTGSDGAYVYFVAKGVLSGNSNLNGERAEADACEPGGTGCNLYVLHDGTTKFIATLAAEDNESNIGIIESGGDWTPSSSQRTAALTPEGESLLFESVRPLTGYDNMVDGERASEIYVYSATDGRIRCASCDPTGVAPSVRIPFDASPLRASFDNTRLVRWMSEDGQRVFFSSPEPLVPEDTNGVSDVYEWEAEGTGSCVTAISIYGGCVYLLSDGQNHDAATFIDASGSGSDVFFTTRARLVTADLGEKTDLYDARECTGIRTCAQEVASQCAENECASPQPPSPLFSAPATSEFEGAGSVTAATTVLIPSQVAPKKAAPKPPAKCPRGKKKKAKRQKCAKSKKQVRKSGKVDKSRSQGQKR